MIIYSHLADNDIIKMLSYRYRDSHYKDKTVSTVLSLSWISPYPERLSSYWNGALVLMLEYYMTGGVINSLGIDYVR